MAASVSYLSLTLLILCCYHSRSEPVADSTDADIDDEALAGLGVEYSRYLKEVSAVLTADEDFQKALNSDDSTGDMKDHYQSASERTRSKLDELKRMELRRLKDLHKQSMKMASARRKEEIKYGKKLSKKDLPRIDDEHVDTKNPQFGGNDLHKLITKTTSKIVGIDQLRRKEFKKHELNKAHQYKSSFRDLSAAEQQQKLREHLEKATHHDRVNHPGNRKQLEEVWQKTDHMGNTKFDPKAFFMMHDIDGDQLLSLTEVEALFERELNKLYEGSNRDQTERDEDRNRMREHLFTEVDLDGDGMINWAEFLGSTKTSEFEADESWESVNDEQQFTDEELKAYEESLVGNA